MADEPPDRGSQIQIASLDLTSKISDTARVEGSLPGGASFWKSSPLDPHATSLPLRVRDVGPYALKPLDTRKRGRPPDFSYTLTSASSVIPSHYLVILAYIFFRRHPLATANATSEIHSTFKIINTVFKIPAVSKRIKLNKLS
ncbi:hypothetical protein APHAL10511_006732 [Amanita phalloides]|nr:hypothetical protein APHAL10511_006732 [Amanita phalloides]